MTVSAGAGGGSIVGGVIGGGAVSGQGSGSVIVNLPQTGAGSFALMLAIAIFLLVAGVFMTGMARRWHELRPAGEHSPAG